MTGGVQGSKEVEVPVVNCTICTEPLEDEKKTVLTCNHIFHTVCVEPWVNANNNCPNCRKPVDPTKPTMQGLNSNISPLDPATLGMILRMMMTTQNEGNTLPIDPPISRIFRDAGEGIARGSEVLGSTRVLGAALTFGVLRVGGIAIVALSSPEPLPMQLPRSTTSPANTTRNTQANPPPSDPPSSSHKRKLDKLD